MLQVDKGGCEDVQDRQRYVYCIVSNVFRTEDGVMLHLRAGIDTVTAIAGKARYIGS